MNTYKLNNLIKKELLKRFSSECITKKHFSFSLLQYLCNKYPITEFTVDNYCCYGEDKCCWQDEETCWINYNNKKTSQEVNNIVYERLREIFKDKELKEKINIYKRKMFIAGNNETIWVVIPMRDVLKADFYLIFDCNKSL